MSQERRNRTERRHNPASPFIRPALFGRRRHTRRAGDAAAHVDWYNPRLLVAALGVVILSCADAHNTLQLLAAGQVREANLLMESLIYRDTALFFHYKLAVTACGVVLLVAYHRHRLFRCLQVAHVLYGLLLGYGVLIGYELYIGSGPRLGPFLGL